MGDNGLDRRLLAVVAAMGVSAPAAAQPVFVVTNQQKFYRSVNGLVQTTPSGVQLSKMVVVPSGVAVPGFAPGDVMAIAAQQNGDGNYNVYRVDGACEGSPSLTLVTAGPIRAGDVAFADGRLYGIDSMGGVTSLTEYDPATLTAIGDPVPLADVTGAGGLAHDGTYFYFSAGGANRLFRYSEATGTERLDPPDPIPFSNSDLDSFAGRLWGALAEQDSIIRLGLWDRATGQFTTIDTLDEVANPVAIGLAGLTCGCPADFNGDGAVDTRDVLWFLSAWSSRAFWAEFNGDGSIDTRDVLAFLATWNTGC